MVTVVVTTKNEEANIARVLGSIKNQTLKDVETVVVDNASTDATVEIAKRFTKKVYNKGPERSAQRNFGVKMAKGEYVLIIDADMELTSKVVESCVENIKGRKALIIPERTEGRGLMVTVRKFEREMYMGDATIEVARFFPRGVFNEFGGYDLSLTGTEDYDLPKRIMDKYGKESIGWAKEWILHHETGLTLAKQLKKKFYYASRSIHYARKHPDLIFTQGNMLLRSAYFRHRRNFLKKPHVAVAFIFVKMLEMAAAVLGFLKGVLTSR